MRNNQLQKKDETGRIAAALALIRGAQVIGDTFELGCVCAVHDKPYTLRFDRQPSGMLRFLESVKVAALKPGRDLALFGALPSGAVHLPLSEMETTAVPCAWCGDMSFHHCSCGALVCGGRMRGDLFICRKSCGAEWAGVALQEVQVTKTERQREPTTPRAVSAVDKGGRQLQRPLPLLSPPAK